jgi:hypothetical protein
LQKHNFWKRKDMLSSFCKSLNSESIDIFLLLFVNHIITASQSTSYHILSLLLSILHSSDQHHRHQCISLLFTFIVIKYLVLSFTLILSIIIIMSKQFSHITRS